MIHSIDIDEHAISGLHRNLGQTPRSQSAGTRRVLIARVVWSDQNMSDTMDDARYLSYATDFVNYSNNRSYGNMVIVPTYTPGCVYRLPNHTSVQAALPANGDSLAGWIFSDTWFAVEGAPPGCSFRQSDFEHVFSIILNIDNVDWAGIAFQPGSIFIVQVS